MTPDRSRTKAVCCVVRGDRHLFTVRRRGGGGCFLIPIGGALEAGESPRQAADREALEEIGLEVTSWRFLGTVTDRFVWRGRRWVETCHLFLTRVDPAAVLPERAHEANGLDLELRWLTLAELAETPLPVLPPALLDRLRNC